MKETMTSTQHPKRESASILVAAIIASLGLIGFTVWFWDIIHIVTPFLILPLSGIVWAVFIGIAVWSLVHVCRKKRFRKLPAYAPLVIQMLSAGIVLTVPFTSIMLDLDFRLRLKQRDEVVARVVSGELKPNVEHNSSLIHLPDGYRHLSKGGGDIIVERNGPAIYVFFFTYRGILDNFSGFMYRSDDTMPKDGDFAGDFFQTKKLKEYWYWTAAN